VAAADFIPAHFFHKFAIDVKQLKNLCKFIILDNGEELQIQGMRRRRVKFSRQGETKVLTSMLVEEGSMGPRVPPGFCPDIRSQMVHPASDFVSPWVLP
jgi:hypothetical protein